MPFITITDNSITKITSGMVTSALVVILPTFFLFQFRTTSSTWPSGDCFKTVPKQPNSLMKQILPMSFNYFNFTISTLVPNSYNVAVPDVAVAFVNLIESASAKSYTKDLHCTSKVSAT